MTRKREYMRRLLGVVFVIILIIGGAHLLNTSSEPDSVKNAITAQDQINTDNTTLAKLVGANNPDLAKIYSEIQTFSDDINALAADENTPSSEINKNIQQLVSDDQQYLDDVKNFISNPTQAQLATFQPDLDAVNTDVKTGNALIKRLYP